MWEGFSIPIQRYFSVFYCPDKYVVSSAVNAPGACLVKYTVIITIGHATCAPALKGYVRDEREKERCVCERERERNKILLNVYKFSFYN